MAAAYFENNFSGTASFELFVRSLPKARGFLLAAGLEQALEYLEAVRFSEDDIAYLRGLPVFQHVGAAFFDYLKEFRFTGEVWAVPEGTPMFGEEPLLRVTAPLLEAQVVETFLLSTLTFQTMIASKAARVVAAAQGRFVVEFGSRRAHGPEAGVLGARAAFVGGCSGTSNLEAGSRYGIPTFGTLAHSFVMAYQEEEEAFRRFMQLYQEHSVLLVDTYDTLAAVEKIIASDLRPRAIRLDSGDLLELSLEVRRRLDQAGLETMRIFASGDLDEFVISDLLARGAKIDAFGVGTALATSMDAPALGGVYKLVDLASETGVSYRAKFSDHKTTYPGRKQVWRFHDANGRFREDIVAAESEEFADAQPLLKRVMQHGKRIQPSPGLTDVQQYAAEQVRKIPESSTQLREPGRYPVRFSGRLQGLLELVRRQVQGAALHTGSSASGKQ